MSVFPYRWTHKNLPAYKAWLLFIYFSISCSTEWTGGAGGEEGNQKETYAQGEIQSAIRPHPARCCVSSAALTSVLWGVVWLLASRLLLSSSAAALGGSLARRVSRSTYWCQMIHLKLHIIASCNKGLSVRWLDSVLYLKKRTHCLCYESFQSGFNPSWSCSSKLTSDQAAFLKVSLSTREAIMWGPSRICKVL